MSGNAVGGEKHSPIRDHNLNDGETLLIEKLLPKLNEDAKT